MKNKIDIKYHDSLVGSLILTNENEVYFEYDENWIKTGFSISPFSLPLKKELFKVTKPYFDGLFGVFADSLPDAWGRLVFDRYLKKNNLSQKDILERLTYVGDSGMGALEYYPSKSQNSIIYEYDLDEIQKDCNKLLNELEIEDINKMYSMSGSLGGARPKILLSIDNEEYLVKFQSKYDEKDACIWEYNYMNYASKCGINIPKIKLLKGKYFAIKRFDRSNKKKIHTITVAALLESDFRAPAVDYLDLLKLTMILTKNKDDIIQMYRRMIFNVLFENLDDHIKNFSFYYDESDKKYRLAPAYDLTKSNTYYGEHTTSVNGKGKDITKEDMIKVGKEIGLKEDKCKKIIDEITMIKAASLLN